MSLDAQVSELIERGRLLHSLDDGFTRAQLKPILDFADEHPATRQRCFDHLLGMLQGRPTLHFADERGFVDEGDFADDERRQAVVEEITARLATRDRRYWRDVRLDFTGAWFGTRADFTNAVFYSAVSFRHAVFAGDASFARARFLEKADFSDASFYESAHFVGARFDDASRFERVWFRRRSRLTAIHGPVADFADTEFTGPVTFKESVFSTGAVFNGARFGSNATFEGAVMLCGGYFQNVGFTGPASFYCAEFGGEGAASFTDATFERDADFRRARVGGPTHFHHARFLGNSADFSLCRFGGSLEFSGAHVDALAHFDGAQFLGPVRVGDATFATLPNLPGGQAPQGADVASPTLTGPRN